MMFWIILLILCLFCIVPCWIVLYQNPKIKQTTSAIQFYQSQIKELENDFNNGSILKDEYDQAKLEIQRRLLKDDKQDPDFFSPNFLSSKTSVIMIGVGIFFIPIVAICMYLLNGSPSLPAQPLAPRIIEQQESNQKILPYIEELRTKVTQLAPDDPKRFEGYILLGQLEQTRNHIPQAIAAWKEALSQHFDPTLAVNIAETQVRLDQSISKNSADLFRQALNNAPKDAPWKSLAEQRIIQYNKQQQ